MEAKKTKSGKWTCCAYYKDATGKVRRPRFTADRKKEAERLAATCSLEHKDDYTAPQKMRVNGRLIPTEPPKMPPMTFREAAIKYVQNREAILAPDTVREYYRSIDHSYTRINDIDINYITREDVQILANTWAQTLSPKTIRNLHGFLSAVLKTYRPEFILTTALPQKIKPRLYTPTDADIQKLLASVRDTRLEIPVLLAALSSLRRSEICALDASDVGDGWIRIDKALVQNKDKKWVIKTTKTEDGTRITYLPKEVTDRIHQLAPSGRVVDMNPNMITNSFPKILKQSGLPHFRFHDLRAYYASILHALGVPDKYIMEWGGWHDQRTLQEHYEKTMADKTPDMAQIGINHFQDML